MRILVVEALGLHLGFLGCYGNDWVGTPAVDQLAAEGVVFDQHFIDSPGVTLTAPADPHCRYESIDAIPRFGKTAVSLVDEWRQSAQTVLWIAGPSLAPPWKLPKGMLNAYFDEDAEDSTPLANPAVGFDHLGAMDPERLQTTYAAVVTAFDAELDRLLSHLRKRRLIDTLLVCVTARCGLPLAEHGMTGMARAWMHDETVHIPLVMRLPGADQAGMRIAAITQSVDLAPTFQEHQGRGVPGTLGQSLWPLIRGTAEQVRPHAACGLRIGASEEWLLRTPDRALLLPISVPPADPPRRTQLYVKPDDRWEVNDLAPRHLEEVETLEATLRALVAATEHGAAPRLEASLSPSEHPPTME